MTLANPVTSVQRPDAPYDLTDEQADVWRQVVEALPADWFGPETWHLLADYCRHTVSSRHMSQLVESQQKGESIDVATLDRALKMRERETRAASSLATRLRITKQATQLPDKVIKRQSVPRPWETK
jgi:hypothetical protein